jgi:hypothetical protein
MTPPAPPTRNETTWVFPALVLHLADGSALVKPQKPVQRACARVTAKITGISARTLERLAQSGFIRRAMPTERMALYYPGEVEAFLRATEADPAYWTPERRRQYGMARNPIRKDEG